MLDSSSIPVVRYPRVVEGGVRKDKVLLRGKEDRQGKEIVVKNKR